MRLIEEINTIYIMALIGHTTEPTTVREAVSRPNALKWKQTMDFEMDSLKTNQTWILQDLQHGRSPISCKWILKKYKSDGSTDRYKARLVARGFSQVEGVDFNETYAPVVKMTTIRVIYPWLQLKTFMSNKWT